MSGGEDLNSVELVAVAKVAKPRGVKGEVACDLLTDFPERFEGLEELIAVFPGGRRERLTLEGHWLHGGRVVLKLEGFDSPEEASALAGCELAVPESEAVELEEGEYYDWQLQGCRVETVKGAEVGTVREGESVDVREVERDRSTTVIEVRVAQPDVGKIIGRQGRTIKALRSLLHAAGQKQGRRYVLEIVE